MSDRKAGISHVDGRVVVLMAERLCRMIPGFERADKKAFPVAGND
jgi:hypothetical protein